MSNAHDEKALKELRSLLGRRLDDLRRERKLTAKAICEDMGWHKSEYSRKHRGLTPLSDEDIVRLRRLLSAPEGWPYVSDAEALMIEALGPRVRDVMRHLPEILMVLESGRRPRR